MEWSSTTFDIIDWDIFCPVYRKQAKKNLQWINKFYLQNLLMGKRLHKIDNCKVTKCYSYGANTEDDDHLFQFKARSNSPHSRGTEEIQKLIWCKTIWSFIRWHQHLCTQDHPTIYTNIPVFDKERSNNNNNQTLAQPLPNNVQGTIHWIH